MAVRFFFQEFYIIILIKSFYTLHSVALFCILNQWSRGILRRHGNIKSGTGGNRKSKSQTSDFAQTWTDVPAHKSFPPFLSDCVMHTKGNRKRALYPLFCICLSVADYRGAVDGFAGACCQGFHGHQWKVTSPLQSLFLIFAYCSQQKFTAGCSCSGEYKKRRLFDIKCSWVIHLSVSDNGALTTWVKEHWTGARDSWLR